jgi:hypothetical protein
MAAKRAPSKHRPTDWPIRGSGLGWQDRWDDPDLDTAVLRLVAEQVRQAQAAAVSRVRQTIDQADA